MPLYDVRSALAGPVMNPEAKKRNQLKKQIAQFMVNPYSVSDNPRAYYSQLKAMATQEGIPMTMPKVLERNPLAVGAYDAADTALFGLLPNQEYLSEGERMAGGVGSAAGMLAAPFTGMAAMRGVSKALPGLSKMMPKSMQDIIGRANKVSGKGKGAMGERVKEFKSNLKNEGIDLKTFGTAPDENEMRIVNDFVKKYAQKGKEDTFRKSILKALKEDKDLGYKGEGLAGFAKGAKAATTGAFKKGNYNFEGMSGMNKGFDYSTPQGRADFINMLKNEGPPNLRKDLNAAIASENGAWIDDILEKAAKWKIWNAQGKQGDSMASWWKGKNYDEVGSFMSMIKDDLLSGSIARRKARNPLAMAMANNPPGMTPEQWRNLSPQAVNVVNAAQNRGVPMDQIVAGLG
tara:strand:- start:1183 stop:2394 length:1212 start_codon:yes stop_codon:yes gene_type:complete